jgi:hypothetical protein
VPHYAKVIQRNVWPGIDIELRASEHGIESVYHVKPGADPSQIVLQYQGLEDDLIVDAKDRLHLKTSVNELTEQSPFAYQIRNRLQSSVPVQFRLLGNNRYGFTLYSYDPSQEVVIDPLVYCTPFPESVQHMVTDADSNKIVCGTIWGGASFPTTPGAYADSVPSSAFVCKLNPDCNNFIFSTFIPGSTTSGIIAVDPVTQNIAFVSEVGIWPVTADAFDTTYGPGKLGIALISSDGSTLLFSSYVGGTGGEYSPDADFDSLGRLYITGTTGSHDFPVTPDAMFPQHPLPSGAVFITVIDWQPARIVYSTYFTGGPGSNRAISIHAVAPGLVWLTCLDINVELPTTPDALIPSFPVGHTRVRYFGLIDINQNDVRYGTYFGDNSLWLYDIVPIDSNHLWLWGFARDTVFIEMPAGGFNAGPPRGVDGFVIKLRLPSDLQYGTFIGGSADEVINAFYCEPSGAVLVSGNTYSADFPTTPDAFDRQHHSTPGDPDSADVFLVRFTPHLDTLLYGTYIGGAGNDGPRDIVCEGSDRIWISGVSGSRDFPFTTTHGFWEGEYYTNSFFLRFSLPPWSDTRERFIAHPSSFSLSCYPNPFNPSTRIEFTIPNAGKVSLKVYDVLGREVAVLVDETLIARDHVVVLDGSDLPSGIYFARLEAAGVSQTRKMVLLK